MKIIFIYVTYPNKKSAMILTNKLLNKKLVACANMSKIDSVYMWKNKKVKNNEWAVIYKTQKNLFTKVADVISKNHPYDIPAIMEIPLGRVDEKYAIWLQSCLTNNK